MEKKLQNLKTYLAEISDLLRVQMVLGWDQQTYMPTGGAEDRGNQLSTLARLEHERWTSPKLARLLDALEPAAQNWNPDSDEAALVRVTRKQQQKRTRVPARWVSDFSLVTTLAQEAWVKARKNDDFAAFQPHLERIVDLRREYSSFFAPYDHVYDPLLDDFEPGMKTAEVAAIFNELRGEQVALIKAIAARQQALGINGRPNRVWDEATQRLVLGRFGWKANQPSIRQQIAAAAIGDMGVTSSLFPKQNCPDVQVLCRAEVPGNDPELTDAAWDDLETWALGLGVPARRHWNDPDVQRGAALFEHLQCAACHVPTLTTADYFPRMPELSRQTIHPYTDLLLHDMGPDLADGRPDFAASGSDWRTPPLWGLGLSRTVSNSTALLHDGRARNVTEAILWHGGEAHGAREMFRALSKRDREALLAFIDAI